MNKLPPDLFPFLTSQQVKGRQLTLNYSKGQERPKRRKITRESLGYYPKYVQNDVRVRDPTRASFKFGQ